MNMKTLTKIIKYGVAEVHVPLSSRGEMTRPWPILSPDPSSQGGSVDEGSVEAVHCEEEIIAIINGCKRLAKAESERWKRSFLCFLCPVCSLMTCFYMLFVLTPE
jgi:hypothetical protein